MNVTDRGPPAGKGLKVVRGLKARVWQGQGIRW